MDYVVSNMEGLVIDKRDFAAASKYLVENGYTFWVKQKGGGFIYLGIDTVTKQFIEQLKELLGMNKPKKFEVLIRVYLTAQAKSYEDACSLTSEIAACIEDAVATGGFDTVVDVSEISEEVSTHSEPCDE